MKGPFMSLMIPVGNAQVFMVVKDSNGDLYGLNCVIDLPILNMSYDDRCYGTVDISGALIGHTLVKLDEKDLKERALNGNSGLN